MPFKSKFNFDSEDIKKAISADAEDAASAVPVADVVALTDSADNVENYMNTWEPARKNVKIALDKLVPAKEEWNFFPEPDQETAILIAKSIYQQGQLAPAIVWEQENGTYMILGGHTRAAIIGQLHEIFPEDDRFNTMLCHVYEFDQLIESEARQIILLNNLTQRAQEKPSLLTRSIISMIELEKNIRKRKNGIHTQRISEEVGKKFNLSGVKLIEFMHCVPFCQSLCQCLTMGISVKNRLMIYLVCLQMFRNICMILISTIKNLRLLK